jgi:hypothetical protein
MNLSGADRDHHMNRIQLIPVSGKRSLNGNLFVLASAAAPILAQPRYRISQGIKPPFKQHAG